MRAAVLAGGTGGAKLAAGLQDVLGAELSVIANTGDDTEALGVHVSPDPDLITYWLSGEIDEARGWGIRGDTFTVFERLVELGEPGSTTRAATSATWSARCASTETCWEWKSCSTPRWRARCWSARWRSRTLV